MNQRAVSREVVAYLALVTVGSITVAVALPNSASAPMLSAIMPVAVLLLITPVLGRSTWSNLGLASTGVRRWPVALAVPTAVAGAAYGIGMLTGVVGAGTDLPRGALVSVPSDIAIGTVLVLGEEVGWRGFLLPRLQLITSARSAALLTGLAHALIHLPLILLTTTYNHQGSRWVVAPSTVVTITAAGVFYAWLRDASGSIWPAAIAHSAGNTLVSWIALTATPGRDGSAAKLTGEGGILTAVAMSAIAVLLFLRARVWRRGADARGTDPRTERASVLDPSGSPR
jgi:uncharacterized protein